MSVQWGMWGAEAMGEERPRCTAANGQVGMLVARDARTSEARVWYFTGYIHEPIVEVRSAASSSVAPVEAIAYSGTLRAGRGPSR